MDVIICVLHDYILSRHNLRHLSFAVFGTCMQEFATCKLVIQKTF